VRRAADTTWDKHYEKYSFTECKICLERIGFDILEHVGFEPQLGGEHFSRVLCAHLSPRNGDFCAKCLRAYVEGKAKDGLAEIKCPASECKTLLYPADIVRLVSPETFSLWRERLNANHKERLKHLSREQIEEMARAKVLVCPRCSVLVSKASGCDKMRCVCGHSFSYEKTLAESWTKRGAGVDDANGVEVSRENNTTSSSSYNPSSSVSSRFPDGNVPGIVRRIETETPFRLLMQ